MGVCFVMMKQVPSYKFDLFWQIAVTSILHHFPHSKVLIVDDNSNMSKVTTMV